MGVEARNGSLDDDVVVEEEARDCVNEFMVVFPGDGISSSEAGGIIPSSVYNQSICTNVAESWFSRLSYKLDTVTFSVPFK